MRSRPLRRKILIYSSSLLITLIAAMLVYVNYQAAWFVNEHIRQDLESGIRRISEAQNEHLAGLELAAQLIASFPELKALLTTTDLATIRDYLLDYQQRNKRPELLIVLDQKGQVVARTDTLAPLPIRDARNYGSRQPFPASLSTVPQKEAPASSLTLGPGRRFLSEGSFI